jgi:hypothetical protein
MKDGRKSNGGKRQGAGRKSKAAELGLAELIDSVWSIQDQKKVFKQLADDCSDIDFHVRHESRKLLFSYKFGKPKESMDVTSNGETVQTILVLPKKDDADG